MGLTSVSRAKPPVLPGSWKTFSELPYCRRIPESPISSRTKLRAPGSLGVQPQHLSPPFPCASPSSPRTSLFEPSSPQCPRRNGTSVPPPPGPAPPRDPALSAPARRRGLGARDHPPSAPDLALPESPTSRTRAGGPEEAGRGQRQHRPRPAASPSRLCPSRPASAPRPPPRGPSRAAPAARPAPRPLCLRRPNFSAGASPRGGRLPARPPPAHGRPATGGLTLAPGPLAEPWRPARPPPHLRPKSRGARAAPRAGRSLAPACPASAVPSAGCGASGARRRQGQRAPNRPPPGPRRRTTRPGGPRVKAEVRRPGTWAGAGRRRGCGLGGSSGGPRRVGGGDSLGAVAWGAKSPGLSPARDGEDPPKGAGIPWLKQEVLAARLLGR